MEVHFFRCRKFGSHWCRQDRFPSIFDCETLPPLIREMSIRTVTISEFVCRRNEMQRKVELGSREGLWLWEIVKYGTTSIIDLAVKTICGTHQPSIVNAIPIFGCKFVYALEFKHDHFQVLPNLEKDFSNLYADCMSLVVPIRAPISERLSIISRMSLLLRRWLSYFRQQQSVEWICGSCFSVESKLTATFRLLFSLNFTWVTGCF